MVLAERVVQIKANDDFVKTEFNIHKKGGLDEVVELLKLSCTYDLDKTKDKAEEYICNLLGTIQSTSPLFDVNKIESIYSLFAPIDKNLCTVYYEDGSEEIVREIIPDGQCKSICHALMNMSVSSDEQVKVSISDLVADLSLETINNADVFPLLLHSYILRAASVATTLRFKEKVADKDKSLRAAKSVINDLLQKTPGTSEQYHQLFQSIEGQVHTQISREWECLFQKRVLTPTRVKQQVQETLRRVNHATSASSWKTPPPYRFR